MSINLSGDYIAGFVDGEGCFALKYRLDRQKNKNSVREYYYWGAEFAIVLHPSDAQLLEAIQRVLNVGKISYKKTGDQVRYSVQDTQELKNIIIPYFQKNRLWGSKFKDFKLWAQAVTIIANHKSKTVRGKPNPICQDDFKKLTSLKKQISSIKRREG